MIREKDIVHENGRHWVLRDKLGFHVMVAGATHSKCDSSYEDPSIAIARADYLAKRERHQTKR